jgi:hypothetical protein
METAATLWPINKYGTTWRRATMYFDWQDEEIVSAAIETINPLKITVRYRRVGAIGFENTTDMVLYRLAEPLPYGNHWNPDKLTIIIDPCTDPDALASLVQERGENVRFSVFGVGVLDLADEGIYETLMNVLTERRSQFVGEYPVIEF